MARRAKGVEMGSAENFFHFPHSGALTSAFSVHNDGNVRRLDFQILSVSTPGFRDQKLSGLYQSFTYVFDIPPRAGMQCSKMVRAMFVNVESSVLETISPSSPVDVSGLCDFRLSQG